MELERKAQTIERRRATRVTAQYRRVAPTSPARTLKEFLGNHAAQLFVARLQRKPSVSADDPLERQADVVADRVMRMSERDVVQRVCKECDEEKKEQPQIQRAASAKSGAGLDVSGAVSATQRSGAALPADVRSFFEPRFGHDFSGVRVHTDGEAARAARGTEARAYTLGRDIVFGANEYAPRTAEGRRLLAHELTHVVQQGGSGSFSPALEAEVARTARGFSNGGPLQFVPGQTHGVAVQCQQTQTPAAASQSAVAPESDLVDGAFWIKPSTVPIVAEPVFDEETNAIVAFRHEVGISTKIWDLEGNVVSNILSEAPLESPLFDPIDFLAGGLTSLLRGLFKTTVSTTVRTAAKAGITAAGARIGVRSAMKALGSVALAAVRATYRAIRFRGTLKFTATTAARMADPSRRVPHHILKLCLQYGTRMADPQGAAKAFQYVIPMIKNGKKYALEVVIRETDNTVLHFLYK